MSFYYLGLNVGKKPRELVYQKWLQILIVVNDTVVNDDELIGRVGALRMRVDRWGFAVRGPSSVRDARMHVEFEIPP